ncbi:hypothetical protein N7501_002938 [Penicillium viridicatum]|nr:hypothetical protein N7501_002938 [Penicillium viridicatum]
MGVRLSVRRAQTVFSRVAASDAASSVHTPAVDGTTAEERKRDPATDTEVQQPETPAEDLQHGVRDIEAMTMTWSKRTLIMVFLNIWFLYFVNAFQSTVFSSLSPYVSSSFTAHSLSGVPTALADAFSAAIYIPVEKMMDTWGRAEGFLLMTCFATLGLIFLEQLCHLLHCICKTTINVFYSIGFSGMEHAIDVMTADASKLKNRGLAIAFTSSPYIITAFAGPKVADEFYYRVSRRWGLGCWAIIFPIVVAPLYIMLKTNLRKAESEGHRIQEKSNRTFLQSVRYWIIQFDLPGVVMFTVGLVLFELPFDIATEVPNGWASGYIIAMLVVGFSMLFFFAIYENGWPLCLCSISSFSPTEPLSVVNDLTIAEAGYVSNTFDVMSGVLLLVVGWIIRRTGRFKWLLYISVPLYIFAQGLMIYFRKPGMGVGYQIMCQIFISIGSSIFILVEQIAILAAVDHQHVAAALGLLNVVGTIGDSAGYTICTAIWTNTFPKALANYFPELAIQAAYGYAEVRMLSAGLGVMALAIAWTIMIRDIDLKKTAQVKGTVF